MRTGAPAVLIAAAILALVPAAQAGDQLSIGASGPDFNLPGTDGAMHSLASVAGSKGTAVIFTCNECPYAKGYEDRLIALAKSYGPRGIGFIAINPNDPAIVPGDSFDHMKTRAAEKNFPYPYVHDTTQATAAAYGALVTPHIFLLDAAGRLVYRGRVDNSLEENKIKQRDLDAALASLVGGRPVPVATTKPFGCSVKWSKKGRSVPAAGIGTDG